MIWNQLSYDLQSAVIDRIVDLLKNEKDDDVVDGIIAAVHELEVWSNSPCQVIEPDRTIFLLEEDPFCEEGWES